ncbi:rhodanese-like domain-containing protein [bacterium]|nr:rhodanese-like domain-containing protein [bacterium]
MKTIYKQAIYIIVFSIIVGMSSNYFRTNGIPIIAKQINGFNNNSRIEEFVIEIIDLEIAQKFFYNDMLFIDARDDISFSEGHITGAISSIPHDEMVDNIFNNQGFNEPVVIYCDDNECGLSEDLGYQLQAEGFSKIYVFSGGWDQWKLAKLPIEK